MTPRAVAQLAVALYTGAVLLGSGTGRVGDRMAGGGAPARCRDAPGCRGGRHRFRGESGRRGAETVMTEPARDWPLTDLAGEPVWNISGRRYRIVRVSLGILNAFLRGQMRAASSNVPPDLHCVDVVRTRSDVTAGAFSVLVESATFEPLSEGSEPPELVVVHTVPPL